MDLLPNGERAFIDPVKITDYVLNPGHRLGRNKARVFRAALGLTQADAPRLQAALALAARTEPGALVQSDAYGQHFLVRFRMTGVDGDRTV